MTGHHWRYCVTMMKPKWWGKSHEAHVSGRAQSLEKRTTLSLYQSIAWNGLILTMNLFMGMIVFYWLTSALQLSIKPFMMCNNEDVFSFLGNKRVMVLSIKFYELSKVTGLRGKCELGAFSLFTPSCLQEGEYQHSCNHILELQENMLTMFSSDSDPVIKK